MSKQSSLSNYDESNISNLQDTENLNNNNSLNKDVYNNYATPNFKNKENELIINNSEEEFDDINFKYKKKSKKITSNLERNELNSNSTIENNENIVSYNVDDKNFTQKSANPVAVVVRSGINKTSNSRDFDNNENNRPHIANKPEINFEINNYNNHTNNFNKNVSEEEEKSNMNRNKKKNNDYVEEKNSPIYNGESKCLYINFLNSNILN